MALEVVHTERSYIVVDSEKWQQPSLVGIIRQLQTKLANTHVARDAKLGALITEKTARLLERLAEITPAWGNGAIHRADLDEAGILAVRIRGVLAQEEHK